MRIFRKKDLRICLLITFVAAVLGGGYLLGNEMISAAGEAEEILPVVATKSEEMTLSDMVDEGNIAASETRSLSETEERCQGLWTSLFSMTTGISLGDGDFFCGQRLLAACLPWRLSQDREEDKLIFHYAAGDESSYFWNQNEAAENPLVAIYSTHSAESYTPYSGQPSVSGSRGGVYVASSVVAETLAKANIGTIVDDTIHDSPDWNKSYSNSLTTARKLLNTYPSIKILIDMHRDAGVPKENTTVEIAGKKAARIMFVVGSNQRYEHPYWEQNLAFAERIGEKMEELYPGLLRTVKVQNGRYNQHISTHSILVEMGATENTIEEVEYSASMLAVVLTEVLREME